MKLARTEFNLCLRLPGKGKALIMGSIEDLQLCGLQLDALLGGGRATVSHIVRGTVGKTVRSVAAAVAAPTAVVVIPIAAIAHWNVVVLGLLIVL